MSKYSMNPDARNLLGESGFMFERNLYGGGIGDYQRPSTDCTEYLWLFPRGHQGEEKIVAQYARVTPDKVLERIENGEFDAGLRPLNADGEIILERIKAGFVTDPMQIAFERSAQKHFGDASELLGKKDYRHASDALALAKTLVSVLGTEPFGQYVSLEVSYGGLGTDELRESNYQDPSFASASVGGVRDSRKYWAVLNGKHPKGPYLRISTEVLEEDLPSLPEVEAALKGVALALRAKTGGNIDINMRYDAGKAHLSPVSSFHYGKGQVLDVIVGLSDTNIRESRNRAKREGLEGEWYKEFKRYTPQVQRKDMSRMFHREPSYASGMDITQTNAVDFIDYLEKELRFADVEIAATDYKGLTLVEFRRSTLPRNRILRINAEGWVEIQLGW